jgi:hypothetical protein
LHKIKLAFRLDFKPISKHSLVRRGFGEVRRTVNWFKEQVEDVQLFASRYTLSPQLLESLDTS